MKRMMRNGRGLVLALLVLAIGAAVPAQAQGGSGPSLAGSSWRLVELNGQPGVGTEPLTLSFGADGQVSGYGGCNQFSGPYTQSGSSLTIGPLASTKRACVDPALNTQETAYFQALQSTTRYSIDGRELVLYSGDQVVARFRRGPG